MCPTYHNMQFVMLDKSDRDYQAGDVIAFQCEGLSAVLVKRIAAVPGEMAMIENGTLYVDGKQQPFYEEGAFAYAGLLETTRQLTDYEYIVIGDNIAESKDSRYPQIGVIRADSIIGKVIQ